MILSTRTATLLAAIVLVSSALLQAEDVVRVSLMDDEAAHAASPNDVHYELAPDHGHDHHDLKHGRVDTHAPAFLMGDHVHKPGEWMVEYKYSNMYMGGNRAGRTRITDQQALDFIGTPPGVPAQDFYVATPLSMTMEMHMLHIMRGVTENITAYIMPMWMVNTMDHQRRNNTFFRTTNSGFSDLQFGALLQLRRTCDTDLILNLGVRAPTGDIDNTTSIPTGSPGVFPYPMRLGHGTWGSVNTLTYKGYREWSSYGMQATAMLPIGLNDARYRVGNEYRATAWYTHLLDCEKKWAVAFRVEGLWRSNFVGADARLNPNMISTADPDMRGGDFLNFGYGLMYQFKGGGRLNFEALQPIDQNLQGVQLEHDWSFAASYSKAF